MTPEGCLFWRTSLAAPVKLSSFETTQSRVGGSFAPLRLVSSLKVHASTSISSSASDGCTRGRGGRLGGEVSNKIHERSRIKVKKQS